MYDSVPTVGAKSATLWRYAGEIEMNAQKLVAIVLIVVGALGVAYGGFSYTSETHNVDLGPIHMSVAEKDRVNIPMWAGVGALVAGAFLLLSRRRIF